MLGLRPGPTVWYGTWELEPTEEGCSLRFTQHSLGNISEIWQERQREGWTYLFDGVLKAHLEGRPLPEFQSSIDG